MPILQILNDINDLKYLRDLYRKNIPITSHGYYTLTNFIKWFELNPHIDHVKVYVLDNWRESGFFIVLDRYQLFINTLKFNVDEVSNALKSWDWRRKYKIFALPAILFPVVEKTLKDLNMNIRMTTLKIYQRDQSFVDTKGIDIPNTLVLRSLSITDANLINETWYSRQNGSLEFLQTLIKYNINLGLYTKDTNELVAWCTRCQCGFLGTLHVKENYRGQGLATVLIERFSQKIIECGEDVRTLINNNNLASQKLFGKLGFKYQEDVFIMYN
ncbi:uncharacterized protein LOC111678378 [Lucilia cuprina]|uniref:uncharacterized protein LOC111678378 n=1 Tax=Lucilia cuprina TaxID=7375 RepID=UPI001F052727|nr:uncharacterized protein LOC111678378 [Lucilia cuprina]